MTEGKAGYGRSVINYAFCDNRSCINCFVYDVPYSLLAINNVRGHNSLFSQPDCSSSFRAHNTGTSASNL